METIATYKIRISNNRKQAEEILQQIDELMLWFESLFPNMEVEI